jgi:hypothetical protein
MNTNTNLIQDISDLEAADIDGGLTFEDCVAIWTISGGVVGGVLGGYGSLGALTPVATGLGALAGRAIGENVCK